MYLLFLSIFEHFSKNIFVYLFKDKGYLSKELAQKLKESNDITLITNVRSNMKPIHKISFEKAILSKRFLIKTVFSTLKSSTNIEYSRHKSPQNLLVNLFSSLVSYNRQRSYEYLFIERIDVNWGHVTLYLDMTKQKTQIWRPS